MADQLLEQILSELRDFRSGVEGRLGGLDTRLDGVEGRLGGLETRLGGVEGRLGGLDTRLDGVEGRLGGLDTRLGGVEGRLGGLETRLETLEVEVKGIKEEHGVLLRALEERTGVISATVTGLVEQIDHLQGEVARTTKRVAGHDLDIRVLKKAVAN